MYRSSSLYDKAKAWSGAVTAVVEIGHSWTVGCAICATQHQVLYLSLDYVRSNVTAPVLGRSFFIDTLLHNGWHIEATHGNQRCVFTPQCDDGNTAQQVADGDAVPKDCQTGRVRL